MLDLSEDLGDPLRSFGELADKLLYNGTRSPELGVGRLPCGGSIEQRGQILPRCVDIEGIELVEIPAE